MVNYVFQIMKFFVHYRGNVYSVKNKFKLDFFINKSGRVSKWSCIKVSDDSNFII